jgi:hypothetical protein
MKEIGWSFARSVVRLLNPAGIVVTPPAKVIGEGKLRTLPRAIVPSWQDKQRIEEPSGWPGTAWVVELLYNI